MLLIPYGRFIPHHEAKDNPDQRNVCSNLI